MDFFSGKRVLITGHTGFKGSWLSRILTGLGSSLCGVSLLPETEPSLFSLIQNDCPMESHICDIRDYDALLEIFRSFNPEIIVHLAAQPIVLESYRDPLKTYGTNVMGTVNVLECVRHTPSVCSVLNVTTDKVYKNNEWYWGYREDDPLDGYDPYSNSKSCSELVTHSYIRSFFNDNKVAISTARAGNVIGGGDFAPDRIIPDCVRSINRNIPIHVRNPHSIRPYQHVLEPLQAYLTIIHKQYDSHGVAGFYNVGPDEDSCINTGDLVDAFTTCWGEGASWKHGDYSGEHEANFLKLDCSKIKSILGWKPKWTMSDAIVKTVEWYKVWRDGGDVVGCMDRQIGEYFDVLN